MLCAMLCAVQALPAVSGPLRKANSKNVKSRPDFTIFDSKNARNNSVFELRFQLVFPAVSGLFQPDAAYQLSSYRVFSGFGVTVPSFGVFLSPRNTSEINENGMRTPPQSCPAMRCRAISAPGKRLKI